MKKKIFKPGKQVVFRADAAFAKPEIYANYGFPAVAQGKMPTEHRADRFF